eukprot:TRINITY_DN19572_c0_g1_i1.p4 TRINITY_DN19572_c0_g1~~TRINITY_DN19572_c0_g1_i1.p4  ORF type:complete len:120 (+),score=47.50 TRINITY_DN19572_c0_g1_i1:75-434(+)
MCIRDRYMGQFKKMKMGMKSALGINEQEQNEDEDLSPIRQNDDENEKFNKKIALSREEFRLQEDKLRSKNEKKNKKLAEQYENQSTIYRNAEGQKIDICLLYTSPSPRDRQKSRMPSSA